MLESDNSSTGSTTPWGSRCGPRGGGARGAQKLPHLINMSAGCPTRLNIPPASFEDWWTDLETYVDNLDLVVVAAAGNNANPWSFWPASFDWAVGVGSVDSDGRVSDFSNWGDSVDVYALGRNVVNALPRRDLHCHEIPDRG